ncbi:hypothetical protein AXF42_Ash010659 [Apostasia shenzhenica]|uniref:rRNA-processing protein FYV7 n=1 Tax=Apostasia shenzhenica TaxID=1088818 RepID=A0A2I0A6P4_9ASPA|nr:hypothetical protein AXF42_Ash010659 [Apostasia shenzhenica]
MKKKNEKRIGGKGLSLEAFTNAKSGSSGYNPSFIKKHREFYKNAKYVKKFKRSVKREQQFDEGRPSLLSVENFKELFHGDDQDDENRAKHHRHSKRKRVTLKVLGEEVEKKRADDEKARREREAERRAKKEKREKAEARRKSLRDNMFKRTRSGQPVMKYRIQHILEGLLQNPNS